MSNQSGSRHTKMIETRWFNLDQEQWSSVKRQIHKNRTSQKKQKRQPSSLIWWGCNTTLRNSRLQFYILTPVVNFGLKKFKVVSLPERMTHGNATSMHVNSTGVHLKKLRVNYCCQGERFIYFPHADVFDAEICFQQSLESINRYVYK